MADSELNITYETLFEILRLEKNRVELQKLDKDFFENVSTYIKEKTLVYNSNEKKSASEMELQQKQLSNIRKITTDIYYRRLKKIISMGLSEIIAPNSVIDTESLHDREKEFFKAFEGILKDYNVHLIDMLKGESKLIPKVEKTQKMVRFISDVPKFIGHDLEHYGPFNADDIATIPAKLADILINKGSVEEIDA